MKLFARRSGCWKEQTLVLRWHCWEKGLEKQEAASGRVPENAQGEGVGKAISAREGVVAGWPWALECAVCEVALCLGQGLKSARAPRGVLCCREAAWAAVTGAGAPLR